jgi:hypothetical protein
VPDPGKLIADVMFRLFPESRDFSSEGDLDLPYVLIGNLVHYLESRAAPRLPDSLVDRVIEFNEWCVSQPSTSSAETDIVSMLTVSFYEPIIESATLCSLVPKLIPLEDYVRGRSYLVNWVGQENYDRALDLYS